MNDLARKRVLVTGPAGFIGANLVRELLRYRCNIHGLVRSTTLRWRLQAVLPQISLHIIDVTDRQAVFDLIAEIRPELVFNLAITTGHPSSLEAQEAMLRVSVLGAYNLLAALRAVEACRFVHLGSSLEYGAKGEPLQENDCLTPATFRGAAKAAATMLCLHFAQAYQFPVLILRPFSVYGYWESPGRLIPTAIMAALRGRTLELTEPGYRRDTIFVGDVVEACILGGQRNSPPGDVINIGTGHQWSNEQIVDFIQTIVERRIATRAGVYPPSPSDTACWVADVRKMKTVLSWEPRYTIQQGLQKTIEWIRSHEAFYASPD